MAIGLMIMDMQQHFLPADKLATIPRYKEALHLINLCGRLFREARQPVFRVYDGGAGRRDDMNYEFIDQIERSDGDIVVHKTAGNAFNGTELPQHVQNHKIDLMLICGYRSESCVHATAIGAQDIGLAYGLIRNGHLSPDREAFAAVERLLPLVDYPLIPSIVAAFAATQRS